MTVGNQKLIEFFYRQQVYGAGVVKVVQGLKIGNWTQEQLFRSKHLMLSYFAVFQGPKSKPLFSQIHLNHPYKCLRLRWRSWSWRSEDSPSISCHHEPQLSGECLVCLLLCLVSGLFGLCPSIRRSWRSRD